MRGSALIVEAAVGAVGLGLAVIGILVSATSLAIIGVTLSAIAWGMLLRTLLEV
jgi:hypothetical protein